jgi:hypothetical protein
MERKCTVEILRVIPIAGTLLMAVECSEEIPPAIPTAFLPSAAVKFIAAIPLPILIVCKP